MKQLQAAVLSFPGSNGDQDLLEAFAAAGFAAYLHRAHEPLPQDVAVVGLPGGFSYGDYWRAGMLASQAAAVQGLRAHVALGGLVLGICNGLQILVEANLLPGALRYNAPPGFVHAQAEVEVAPAAKASPWLRGLAVGQRLRLPIAHGEGNYFHPEGAKRAQALAALTYVHNPNGSQASLAALCDPSGQILGIMPHPERAIDSLLGSADGLQIFTGAYQALAGAQR